MKKHRKYNNELDDLKKWYLEELKAQKYNELTINNAHNLLQRVRDFEVNYVGRLIQDFTYNDYVSFLKLFGSSSEECLLTYRNMIRRYLNFCVYNNKMDEGIDYLSGIDLKKLVECVDSTKSQNRYITYNQVYEVIDGFVNYQDKALFLMIYEGIRGVDNVDIINLKRSDIDFENWKITIKNKKDELITRDISKELIEVLDGALRETVYFPDNKLSDEQSKDDDSKYDGKDIKMEKLAMNEYVLRPSLRYLNLPAVQDSIEDESYTGECLTKSIITNRFHKITKHYSNVPFLTQTTLYRSGLMNRVVDIHGIDVTKKDFAKYCMEEEGLSLGTAYKTYKSFVEFSDTIRNELEKEKEEE